MPRHPATFIPLKENPQSRRDSLGFHWSWLAIHRTEPDFATRFFAFTGFPAKRIVPGLTFEEALKLVDEYMSGTQDAAAGCEFEGWTMLRGSALLAGKSATDAAKFLGADVCLAYAESTTWALGMEYGRPDGLFRKRTFLASENPMDVGIARVRDATGKVVGWNLAPKALIGPNGTSRRPEEAGSEKAQGNPLPGEPGDIVISDDIKLLKVLTAIGVPVERIETRYSGTFDYARGTVVPGLGTRDKAFTFYGIGDAPAPKKQQQPAPKSERRGFFQRFKG